MKITLPTWDTYCENTTGKNALVFNIGDSLRVWYSYKTPIAFKYNGGGIVVRVNDWRQTTGKHLNAIDGGDKKSRVPGADFEHAIAQCLEGLNLELPSV